MLFLRETISEPVLSAVFEEIRQIMFPVYRYLQGNCHCVAHLASMILDSKGIRHRKVWIFAPSRYNADSSESFRVFDKNLISPTGWINWGYHVAPMVNLKGRDYIFDYNFSELRPLQLTEWLECFQTSRYRCLIEDAGYFLFYVSERSGKQLFDGQFYPLEGECLESNRLEKGLAINETALRLFEELSAENPPEQLLAEDYRQLAGRVLNFECVFRDHAFNKKMTPEFQLRHADLISRYREIYAHNVIKWKLVTDHYRSRA